MTYLNFSTSLPFWFGKPLWIQRLSNKIRAPFDALTLVNLVLNFTKTSINCEGATYPDDEYILPESCYLEYELNYMPIVQLGNITKITNVVNVTAEKDMCYDFDFPSTIWPFNELSDDPDTQKVMLFTSVVFFVTIFFTFNCCNCNNKKRYVVDNAEEASESDSSENEEFKM